MSLTCRRTNMTLYSGHVTYGPKKIQPQQTDQKTVHMRNFMTGVALAKVAQQLSHRLRCAPIVCPDVETSRMLTVFSTNHAAQFTIIKEGRFVLFSCSLAQKALRCFGSCDPLLPIPLVDAEQTLLPTCAGGFRLRYRLGLAVCRLDLRPGRGTGLSK